MLRQKVDISQGDMMRSYIACQKGSFLFYTTTVSFALLTFLVATDNSFVISLDMSISEFSVSHYSSSVYRIMMHVTKFGGLYFLLPLSALSAAIAHMGKRDDLGGIILCSLIFSAALSYIVKVMVERQRPFLFLASATGYSYPSGHMAQTCAFLFCMIYISYKCINNIHISFFVIALSVAFMAIIGFSRVYLHVHYISDIFGGTLLASMVCLTVMYLFGRMGSCGFRT